MNWQVSPSDYREKFVCCGPNIPVYCKYDVAFSNGHNHLFSITRLPDGKYSLVHFNDFRQKDKHYSTFDRAYNGMYCIIRRLAKLMEVA